MPVNWIACQLLLSPAPAAVSAPLSPPRWRPPTPCCWPVGPLTGWMPSRIGSAPRRCPLDLTDVDAIESSCEHRGRTRRAGAQRRGVHPRAVSLSRRSRNGAPPSTSMSLAPWRLRWRCYPRCGSARGHVVFINSGSGRKVSSGMASYSASKFALRAFADSLRDDEPAAARDHDLSRPDRHRHAARTCRVRGWRVRPRKVSAARDRRRGGRQCGGHPAGRHVHEVIIRPGRR